MHLCVSDVQVAFYSLITYFATAMGTNTVAAHQVGSTQTVTFILVVLAICNELMVFTMCKSLQVMIQMYGMCVVWGEPLSQTAQSFMPELLYGVNQSLEKVSDIHLF